MLRRITADDARFKSLTFTNGLNIVVSDTTPKSQRTDSRNGAGKSSLVELIHFLLGSRVGPQQNVAGHRKLKGITFDLFLDWPGQPNGVHVRRRASDGSQILLDPDVSAAGGDRLDLGHGSIRVEEWIHLVERSLFGLPADHPGVSGRVLLSYLARRVRSHGFNDPVLNHSRQSESEAATNLAYLLGLDWHLAGRYNEIKARDEMRRQLRKAAADPVWGRIVGSAADLRGQITVAEIQVSRLDSQTKNFQVVPEYENLKDRANAITRRIRQLGDEDVADQRNLDDLRRAVADAAIPDIDYVESVYEELGVIFGEQVRRRFDDVYTFHQSVVRNRRRHLEEEIRATQSRLDERRAERARLGREQETLLRLLDEGGALEALTMLQRSLAREQARLEALRHRYEAAQTLEASRTEITALRARLQQEVETDLEERRNQVTEATLLFFTFAQELYGDGREAYLAVHSGGNSLKIEPRIASDDSLGIGKMVTFCFDLTLAVLAHRAGRAPDFLVHDSHLFDGVDARQTTNALRLAVEVTEREGMQYIVTLNSDDLEKAVRLGFEPDDFIREPRLTDAFEDGGLFGFRF